MAIRTLFTALALALGLTSAGLARPFEVPADHAALIRLPGPASAIIIGNPIVADATLYDAQTIFLTGKAYGRTNLIALDASGAVIYSSDLVVTQATRDRVEVFRNNVKESFVCSPDCVPVPETHGGAG